MAVAMGAAIAATTAVWRFLPLFNEIRHIAFGRIEFFVSTILPISLAHTVAVLFVWLLAGRRGWAVVGFEIASGLSIVAAGGSASIIQRKLASKS